MNPIRWERFPPKKTEVEWDLLSDRAGDDNPFQSSAWGRYKRPFGWESERWVAFENGGGIVCSLQLLKKPLPFGRSLIWAPGGPVVGFPGADSRDRGALLSEGLREICLANRAVYARFYSLRDSFPEAIRALSVTCRIPRHRLGSGTTVQVDLTPSLEQLLSGMASKHRYAVRRIGPDALQWKWGVTDALISDLARLHEEMSFAKKVSAADQRDLQQLVSAFGENIFLLVGYSGQEAVTGCLVLLKGKSAFYWRAATVRRGREMSAAYAMIPQLFRLLKSRGIERFDFGGILPGEPAAAGINHFKQGFGGRLVEYLGEWEWANPSWFCWGVNAWVGGRRH